MAARRTSTGSRPEAEPLAVRTAVHVWIVDDQRVFADALSSRLDFEGDVSVVGACPSDAAALAAIERAQPDVVIVDFGAHGGDDGHGERLIAELHRRHPGVGAVVVLGHEDTRAAVRAVRAGARAIVPCTAPLSAVVDAVRSVRAGESHIPPRLLTSVLEALARPGGQGLREPLDRLTPRELDVLRELAAGHDRQVIGERLSISVNTLRTHIKHILGKLDVHSTLNAVTVALNAGLDVPSEGSPREEAMAE